MVAIGTEKNHVKTVKKYGKNIVTLCLIWDSMLAIYV